MTMRRHPQEDLRPEPLLRSENGAGEHEGVRSSSWQPLPEVPIRPRHGNEREGVRDVQDRQRAPALRLQNWSVRQSPHFLFP